MKTWQFSCSKAKRLTLKLRVASNDERDNYLQADAWEGYREEKSKKKNRRPWQEARD